MHPILWKAGPFTFYSYGALMAAAVLIAVHLSSRQAWRIGATPAKITDIGFWSVVAGLLGARIVYIAQNWPVYLEAPLEVFRLDHGGLVFYGGLAAGIVAALLLIRQSKLPLLGALDIFMAPLALAHALGRVGCFLNGCCYGKATDFLFGVQFPGDPFPRHPTQLYESAFLFMLSLLLGWRLKRVGVSRPGSQLGIYLLAYAAWRFGVEFLRGDNPPFLSGFTFSQVVSIPTIFFGLWLSVRRR